MNTSPPNTTTPDTLNIKTTEFPFHTPIARRAGGSEAQGAGGHAEGQRKGGKGHNKGGINTPGSRGGEHMSSNGGREGKARSGHPQVG